MKALRITSWTLIAFSLIFKLLHYPFAGPLVVLGALLLFIHAIIFLFQHIETNYPDIFFHLNISIWTSYLMFRYMFWPFAQIVFMIAVCAGFAYIVLLGINKSKIQLSQIILFVYICTAITISYTQGHYIYYFFNLNSIVNSEESKELNYASWDKYSWFLYSAAEKTAALEANQHALKAAEKSVQIDSLNREASLYVIAIKEHAQQIQTSSWKNYTCP